MSSNVTRNKIVWSWWEIVERIFESCQVTSYICFKVFKFENDEGLFGITCENLFRGTFVHSFFVFFSIWVFFHEHSRFTGQQGKGEGIYLTPLYHFHPLHRHLDISQAITAESSPLHIAGSRTHWLFGWPYRCKGMKIYLSKVLPSH